ncbi:MAG: 3-deoxy-manno-octulosonate cytidylyltransferase [Desulfobacterales bacterium]|nr:3-deoxy-manno-octulosonate cytidylyltransferase [Desulfobacterales bacterium]
MPVAVIPARYGSSRLEGKPLADIKGKSMIRRVYEQAQKSAVVTRTVVATDDERIVSAVEAFGGEALMTSDTCRSGTDRVAETADILGLAPQDILINIQGDQPVFDPRCLEDLIRPFDRDKELVMSTLAFKIQDEREITDPKDVKVVFDRNGFALYFSRAQVPFPRDGQTGVDYYKHLGFYAYTKKFLDRIVTLETGICEDVEKLEQLRVLEHGFPIKVAVTPYDSPEIDLPEDIERIEARLR